MARPLAMVWLGLVLTACGGDDGGDDGGDGGGELGALTVMSRNLYVGFDIETLLSISSQAELLAAAGDAHAAVIDSDVPGRMEQVAAEIATSGAELVGLQEAFMLRSQSPGDQLSSPTPATEVEVDTVGLLLEALAARGLDFTIAAEGLNADLETPTDEGTDVRLTDRDVILVAAGIEVSEVEVVRYTTVRRETVGALPFPISVPRGFVAVTATIEGASVRFADTHLETQAAPEVQVAQGNELLAHFDGYPGPLVLAGDFNSDALGGDTTATYANVIAGGFEDAWAAVHPEEPGLTCCHADLAAGGALHGRIDFIFSRGGLRPTAATVTGAAEGERTEAGLWPSDHAGVTATLEYAD